MTPPRAGRQSSGMELDDLVAKRQAPAAHRMATFDGATIVCDCGEGFEFAVDLEIHQHAFMHPGAGAR
jgi:hypothetical protein